MKKHRGAKKRVLF